MYIENEGHLECWLEIHREFFLIREKKTTYMNINYKTYRVSIHFTFLKTKGRTVWLNKFSFKRK